jgi:hypothetical protein
LLKTPRLSFLQGYDILGGAAMKSVTFGKGLPGKSIDLSKVIDIMIIVGLTALMMFHLGLLPGTGA